MRDWIFVKDYEKFYLNYQSMENLRKHIILDQTRFYPI